MKIFKIILFTVMLISIFTFTFAGKCGSSSQDSSSSSTELTEDNAESEADKLLKEIDDI